jgi:hypothetical protein
MKCEQVEERLMSLVYGELPPEERDAVDEHVIDCERCSREAAVLRKTHSLLQDAAAEEEPTTTLPLAQVSQRAMQKVERSRRRWRTFAFTSASAAVVLVVLQLLSVRITIDQSQFEIAWGEPKTIATSAVTDNSHARPTEQHVPALQEHQTRLDDLDRLIHFLIRLNEADTRGRDRDVVALRQRLDSLQKQNETWQRTIGYLIRNARLDNDLARQQITPTRLEGDFE